MRKNSSSVKLSGSFESWWGEVVAFYVNNNSDKSLIGEYVAVGTLTGTVYG